MATFAAKLPKGPNRPASKTPPFDGFVCIQNSTNHQIYNVSDHYRTNSNYSWRDFSAPCGMQFEFVEIGNSYSGTPLLLARCTTTGTVYYFIAENINKFIKMADQGFAKLNVKARRHGNKNTGFKITLEIV